MPIKEIIDFLKAVTTYTSDVNHVIWTKFSIKNKIANLSSLKVPRFFARGIPVFVRCIQVLFPFEWCNNGALMMCIAQWKYGSEIR